MSFDMHGAVTFVGPFFQRGDTRPKFQRARRVTQDNRTQDNRKQDLADVAAGILQAETRTFAEHQAHLQMELEAHEAKFNLDLQALAPQMSGRRVKSESPNLKIEPEGTWLLARKCWAWLLRH
jgi:hypothetical protein